MRIGIDLDNTIACYDGVFHAAALERGLVPPDMPQSKNAVRDHLNGSGRSETFTALQGYVYGARMDLVAPYPGVREFLAAAHAAGHELFVVSHKTRHPLLGPRYDLHAAARAFLTAHGLVGDEAIPAGNVFLEPSQAEKLQRAACIGCDVFIDDLPEVLGAPLFPPRVRALLFDPEARHTGAPFEIYRDWPAIGEALLATEAVHAA